MRRNDNYISYAELAYAVGCSYSTILKKHIPKIISLYHIDKERMPCRGLLPIKYCEDYFGISLREANKKTR